MINKDIKLNAYFKGVKGLHGVSWDLARDYWAGEVNVKIFEQRIIQHLLKTDAGSLRKDLQCMAMLVADLKVGKITEAEIRRHLLLMLLKPKVYGK